ncbi:hypothetical protein [Herbaspirillum sp. CAH-3]|uniref:hypothetical protein n=1 Tax=Herbaspirillum sp. CAH-3 TaxID=2605746 RepID=UPI0012ACF533|nr:hypothetical protein [Herbaspirillum sp. CAH-3]MRT30848.1 hypothetical protein [Herbaspirillum sp. CAH-3]
MNKHTPTPWLVEKANVHAGQVAVFYDGEKDAWFELWSEHWGDGIDAKANAEYAARCVNSHEALVRALRDCVSVFEGDLDGLAVIQPELRQARAALAAAGAPQ